MRRALLLCLGVILLALGAFAQYGRERQRRESPGMALIDRSLHDLDGARARSRAHLDTFDRARKNLLRVRENLAVGRFDRDHLDNAIVLIGRLARADRMNPRDMQILQRDTDDLSAWRARREQRR